MHDEQVVFVSTIYPYPADWGKKVVLSGMLRYLSERYSPQRVTYILLGSSNHKKSLRKEMPCRVLTLKKPGVLKQLWNVLWLSLIKREKSIQESMLYSVQLGRKLRASIAKIAPDLVVCDTYRTGQFFETTERPGRRYILYMDDLFSVRYRRMLEVLARFTQVHLNLLGTFAQFVPSSLAVFVRFRSLKKWVLQMEQKLVEKREQDCIKWFDSAVLLNEAEAALLRSRTGDSSIQTIKPLLLNTRKVIDRDYNGEPIFIFMGALNLPHNDLSIRNFIETQMPKVVETIPGIRLRIIGRDPSKELLELSERYKNIISLEGFVDDLDAVFSNSCAILVPLLFGSGVKIKTLEALSRGLPVISTDFGVEGISVTSTVNCIVENDIGRYHEVMSALLGLDYNSSISSQAREFYFRNYSKEHVFQEYDLIFG